MLEASPSVVTVKYKRRKASAVRNFPKGCGRLNADDDAKPREETPAAVGSELIQVSNLEERPLLNGAVDKQGEPLVLFGLEPLKVSTVEQKTLPNGADHTPVEELLASAGLEPLKTSILEEKALHKGDDCKLPSNAAKLPVAEDKASSDEVELASLLKVLKQEGPEESARLTEGLKLKGVESSKGLEVLSTETKEEEGEEAFAGQAEKLDGLESTEPSQDHWLKVDEGLKKQGISKVLRPLKRRKVSAVRDFPVGCGPNPRQLASKECAEVAAAAPPADEKPAREVLGKIPSTSKFVDVAEKCDNINKIQESVQRHNPAIALPESTSLNGEKEPLAKRPRAMEVSIEVESAGKVENDSVSKVQSAAKSSMMEDAVIEQYQNKILARSASEKRIDAREMKIVNKNLQVKEAQRSKIPSLDVKPQSGSKLINKEGERKVKEKSIMMLQKDTTKLKRKISGNEGCVSNVQNNGKTFEAHGNRFIVQALMAAQYCPWRNSQKSGAIGSHSVTPKSRVKKEKPISKNSALKQVENENENAFLHQKEEKLLSKRSALKHVGKEYAFLPQNGEKLLSRKSALIQVKNEDAFLPQNGENERALTLYERPGGLQDLSVTITPLTPSEWNHKGGDGVDVSARIKVKRALRLFQLVSRKLLQSEEAKAKKMDKKTRIDLKAAEILKNENEFVNTGEAILGNVPGVEVGDEFQYRVELSVVGLHRIYQGGIDSVKWGGARLATSIVASGGYPDEMDGSDVLIYTGSGGNPVGGNKRPEDQKLERGNLALKNSMEKQKPVRVIRGFKELKGSKMVSTFTYDGLYLVERYWQEKGSHGCFVFKFQLRRMPGQPELALKEVKMTKKSRVREGLCANDISGGKESIQICAVNTVDDERPPPFTYITSNIYPSWYVQTPPKGCECINGCLDSAKCACAFKNGGEIPFNFNGAIVQAKPLVYECGPSCKCPPTCYNRVSQHGIKVPLEIFKTKSRGWGVRSLCSIPSGSFICEYIGELLKDTEAEQRTNDEYLFDIGHNYDDHPLWEGLPTLIPDLLSTSSCETVEDLGYTIDADKYGNVGRFINHSCSPNLYAQNVLYDHDDKRMPHIMFFAADNIPPLQELTYHYNYTIDQVRDSKGNIKRKDCYCGSPECCGRLY